MSHYQGDIFWKHVGENDRITYVYLKATEADDNIDARYLHNIKQAQLNGLQVGSYHFFRPRINLNEQLKNFRSQCRPENQDLIPMIDVETNSKMSTGAFRDSLRKFLIMVEQEYGQKPLVYTYKNFYNKYLQGQLDDYKLMIAQYSDEEPVLADGHEILMWQYTAKGRIKGVNTYVDKSRFMGRYGLPQILYHKNKSKKKYPSKPRYKKKKRGSNGYFEFKDPGR